MHAYTTDLFFVPDLSTQIYSSGSAVNQNTSAHKKPRQVPGPFNKIYYITLTEDYTAASSNNGSS